MLIQRWQYRGLTTSDGTFSAGDFFAPVPCFLLSAAGIHWILLIYTTQAILPPNWHLNLYQGQTSRGVWNVTNTLRYYLLDAFSAAPAIDQKNYQQLRVISS